MGSWEIPCLNRALSGAYYYMYSVEDIFSPMLFSWTIDAVDSAVPSG